MKIVLENSVYSFFLYLLIDNNWEQSIFILDEPLYDKVCKKMEKIKIYKYRDLSYKKHLILFYIEKFRLFFYLFKMKILGDSSYYLYGEDMMMSYFYKKRKIHLIEDGTWSYKIREEEKTFLKRLKRVIRLENPFYNFSGEDNSVEKVYLTGLGEIPVSIKEKVEIVDLKKLWDEKTIEERNKILNFFDINLEKLKRIKSKKYLLLTQPLSEDGTLSEKEKIEIYSEILSNYDLKDIVIKVHPREKLNYGNIFPEVEILDEYFPVELFKIFNIEPEKVITIFSSAVFGIAKRENIDFYGTEINEKILKKFGSMDHIMVRNKFLIKKMSEKNEE